MWDLPRRRTRGSASSRADWVLTLNPDLLMEEDFVRRLVDAGELDAGRRGLRETALDRSRVPAPYRNGGSIPRACFSPRPCGTSTAAGTQPDDGAYDRAEYVFGACAAAALYRRQMIDDVSIGGDFFDPDFFAYREDADVAWRAQLLGWRCIYTPAAVGWHVRSVVPGERRSITPSINMHSVKNRFLMRIKNATPGLYRHCWLPMTARDLVVVAGCLLVEPRSLPAFWQVAKCWPYDVGAAARNHEAAPGQRPGPGAVVPL